MQIVGKKGVEDVDKFIFTFLGEGGTKSSFLLHKKLMGSLFCSAYFCMYVWAIFVMSVGLGST